MVTTEIGRKNTTQISSLISLIREIFNISYQNLYTSPPRIQEDPYNLMFQLHVPFPLDALLYTRPCIVTELTR